MFNAKTKQILDTLDSEDYCCFFQNASKETWSWIKAGALQKRLQEEERKMHALPGQTVNKP